MYIREWIKNQLKSILLSLEEETIKGYDRRLAQVDSLILKIEQQKPNKPYKIEDLTKAFQSLTEAYKKLAQEHIDLQAHLDTMDFGSDLPLLVRVQKLTQQANLASVESNDPIFKVIDRVSYNTNDFVIDYYEQHNPVHSQTVTGMRAWVIEDLKTKLMISIRKHQTLESKNASTDQK